MNNWQPIETSPKDGTRVIIFVEGNTFSRVTQAQWWMPHDGCSKNKGYWGLTHNDCILSEDVHGIGATHWMPLPDPPKDKKE